jgi:hypothetical protein
MRWAVEDCQLDGAAKPILFVIAYRANRDTGECWAGQRRIAREAGVTRTHVQRVMADLIRTGVLEVVEAGSGTKANIVRIAPGLVEGSSTASGVVEGESTATNVVEGQALVGEVIHNPSSQWPPHVAASDVAMDLMATFGSFSGHIEATRNELVATWGDDSGHSHVPLSRGNAEKGFNQGSLTSREDHVLDDADPTADAVGVVEAPEPPPSLLRELERRGLRPKSKAPAKPEQRPRSREEQLAHLERQIAEDEAKAKNSQEGKTPT